MLGHYFRNLDDKKRVAIPPKLRMSLGDKFYLSIGPDRNLEIRDSDSFQKWRDKLLGTNFLNKSARKFARVLLGNTEEMSLDTQGRIKIPNTFAHRANLTKEIALVGVGNKIEIFDRTKFEEMQNEFDDEDALDALAKELLESGVEL